MIFFCQTDTFVVDAKVHLHITNKKWCGHFTWYWL